LDNTLLRIAATQYDYKAADNTFLAKEALDEYLPGAIEDKRQEWIAAKIDPTTIKDADLYAAVLADIALGTQDLDIAQQKATDSLEEYQKAADKLFSDDKLANYLD
jgi:hypothetical protein